jgi:sigma-70-like protein
MLWAAEIEVDDHDGTWLAREAQRGSNDAFVLLYGLHVGSIERFVRSRVHHAADVEDLVSATFVQAWHDLDRFNHERGGVSNLVVWYCPQRRKKRVIPEGRFDPSADETLKDSLFGRTIFGP